MRGFKEVVRRQSVQASRRLCQSEVTGLHSRAWRMNLVGSREPAPNRKGA